MKSFPVIFYLSFWAVLCRVSFSWSSISSNNLPARGQSKSIFHLKEWNGGGVGFQEPFNERNDVYRRMDSLDSAEVTAANTFLKQKPLLEILLRAKRNDQLDKVDLPLTGRKKRSPQLEKLPIVGRKKRSPQLDKVPLIGRKKRSPQLEKLPIIGRKKRSPQLEKLPIIGRKKRSPQLDKIFGRKKRSQEYDKYFGRKKRSPQLDKVPLALSKKRNSQSKKISFTGEKKKSSNTIRSDQNNNNEEEEKEPSLEESYKGPIQLDRVLKLILKSIKSGKPPFDEIAIIERPKRSSLQAGGEA